jgi:hypothetical protein
MIRLKLRGVLCLAAFSPVLALAVACGSGTPGPAAPTPSDTPAVPAPPASVSAMPTGAPVSSATPEAPLPTVWSDAMPKEQQIAFMKKNVMPAMGPVFKGHDAARYAEFSCKTCHGPELKDPNEFLPKLTMKGDKLTAFADKPAVAKWMAEEVSPKMAAAMGLPPFDMKTKQGFGCGGCHKVEMK